MVGPFCFREGTAFPGDVTSVSGGLGKKWDELQVGIWDFQEKVYICTPLCGELAQLARALAWHARGHRFDSGILHKSESLVIYLQGFYIFEMAPYFVEYM